LAAANFSWRNTQGTLNNRQSSQRAATSSKISLSKATQEPDEVDLYPSLPDFFPEIEYYFATGRNSSMHSNRQRISTQVVNQIALAVFSLCPYHADASKKQVSNTLSPDTENVLISRRVLVRFRFPLISIAEFPVSRTLAHNSDTGKRC
jgi:hypothetical protein